jgi:hypothetical protein
MSNGNPCCVSDFHPGSSRKRKPQSATAMSLAEFRYATGSVAAPHLLPLPHQQTAKRHLTVDVQGNQIGRRPNFQIRPFYRKRESELATPRATKRHRSSRSSNGPADGHDDDRTPTRRGRPERGLQRRR